MTSDLAKNIWRRCDWLVDIPNGLDHAYLRQKGIDFQSGVKRGRVYGSVISDLQPRFGKARFGSGWDWQGWEPRAVDCVVVPIYRVCDLVLQGVECINAQGKKQTFGKKLGGCFIFGDERQQDCCWYVHEGWASAAVSFRYHRARVSVCAFGKSQLESVARALADTYQPNEIKVMREQDR